MTSSKSAMDYKELSTWCIFCLRNSVKSRGDDTELPENVTGTGRGRDLQQFLKIFPRYTGRGSKNPYDDFCQVLSSLSGDGREGDGYYGTCKDCSLVLQDFCVFYEKVKVLEIKLDWKLQTLKSIMKSADKVPSRMRSIQEDLEGKDDDKFGMMKEFRRKFVKRASKKLKTSLPRVKVERYLPLPGAVEKGQNFEIRSESNHNQTDCDLSNECLALAAEGNSGQRKILLSSVAKSFIDSEEISKDASEIDGVHGNDLDLRSGETILQMKSIPNEDESSVERRRNTELELEVGPTIPALPFLKKYCEESEDVVDENEDCRYQDQDEVMNVSEMNINMDVKKSFPVDREISETESVCNQGQGDPGCAAELASSSKLLPGIGTHDKLMSNSKIELCNIIDEVIKHDEGNVDDDISVCDQSEVDLSSDGDYNFDEDAEIENPDTPDNLFLMDDPLREEEVVVNTEENLHDANRRRSHVKRKYPRTKDEDLEKSPSPQKPKLSTRFQSPSLKQLSLEVIMKSLDVYRCNVKTCVSVMKSFFNPQDLQRHSSHHGTFSCSFCPVRVDYAPNLCTHEIEEHSPDTGKCPRCSFQASAVKVLKLHHLKSHLNLIPNRRTCGICLLSEGNKSSARESAKRHYLEFHDLTGINLEAVRFCREADCRAYFRTIDQLKRHLSSVHGKVELPSKLSSNLEKIFFDGDKFSVVYSNFKKSLRQRKRSVQRPTPVPSQDVEGDSYGEDVSGRRRSKRKCVRAEKRKQINAPVESESDGNNSELEGSPPPKCPPSLKELAFDKTMKLRFECSVQSCASRIRFFFNHEDYLRHSLHHGDFHCNFCNKKVDYAPSLCAHEIEKHSKRMKGRQIRFKCPRCEFESSNFTILKVHHLKMHMNLTPDRRTCGICGLIAKNQGSVLEMAKEHYLVYHDLTRVVNVNTIKRCGEPNCRAYFRTEDQLNQHLALVHKVESVIPMYRARIKDLSLWNRRALTASQYQPKGEDKAKVDFNDEDEDEIASEEESEAESFPNNGPGSELESESESSSPDTEDEAPSKFTPSTTRRRKYFINLDWIASLSLSPYAVEKLSYRKFCKFPNCYDVFFCDEDLEVHSRLHGTFHCHSCNLVMTSAQKLFKHEMSRHANKRKHEKKSDNENVHECPRCEHTVPYSGCWRNKAKLLSHYLEAHFNLQSDYQTCPVCSKKLSNRSGKQRLLLQLHLQNKHDFSTKNYKCNVEGCEAYFNKKLEFEAHRRTHKMTSEMKTEPSSTFAGIKLELVPAHESSEWIESLSLSPYAKDRLSNSEFPCNFDYCEDIFFSEDELRIHSTLHGNFKCHSLSCDVVETSVKMLFRHETTTTCQRSTGISGDVASCPRCEFSVPSAEYKRSKAKLMNHYLEHHFNLTMDYMTCPVCNVKLYDRCLMQQKVLRRHLQKCHNFSAKIYKCGDGDGKCEAYFNAKHMLNVHRNRFHKKPKKKEIQNVSSSWIESLSLSPHAMDKLSQRRPCNFGKCKDVFYSEEDLEVHSKLHGEFQCHSNSCKRVVGSVKLLFRHELSCKQKKNQNKDVYSCPRCEYSVSSKGKAIMGKLRRHYAQEHFNLQMDYQTCPVCKKKLSNSISKGVHPLQVHLQIVHNYSATAKTTVYKCTEPGCEAYFNQKTLFIIHRNNHDIVVEESEKKFQCRDCHRTFRSILGLQGHRKEVHMKHLPYPCPSDACIERFDTQEQVDHHVSTSGMMICPECGKCFHGAHGLNTHIRMIHENAKPKKAHICEICGKDFRDGEQLRLHSLSHSGPESWEFACEICGKKIMTKQKLQEHMRTHSKEKPFTCEICGVSYAHRHNLRIHVNNKHSDVTSDPPKKFDKSRLVSRKGIKLMKPTLEKATETGPSTRRRSGRLRKRPRTPSFSSGDSNITD